MRLSLLLALATLPTGCRGGYANVIDRSHPAYRYTIAPPATGSWTLDVEARFANAPSERLVLPESAGAVREVSLVNGEQIRPLSPIGGAWLAPSCRTQCTVHYSVDLAAMADSCRHMDCGRRVGDAILGPAIAWMLRPEPTGDAELRVDLRGGDATRFATGLRRAADGGYVFRARELGETSYTAFGTFRRARADVPGARVDVALLGEPLAMGDAAAVTWVAAAARCVASLFGRFPVDATVFVVPVPGEKGVVFGRVMSLAGASVALLFGADARPTSMHSDWVAVHELFHVGTPSFVGEAHWLEEGLATYYEPVLRERAGWMAPEDLWRHFAREMPRGLRKEGDPPSLEDRDDIDSTYWGGALFAMLADVRIRQASRGQHSLDDVLRAALAVLGDSTHEARLSDFVRVGDAATGTHVLADLVGHFATAGEPVDLDALLHELGVDARAAGNVVLRDDAPLAAVRMGISAGEKH